MIIDSRTVIGGIDISVMICNATTTLELVPRSGCLCKMQVYLGVKLQWQMINHWYLTKWNEFKLLSPARVETLLYLIQQHIPAFREFDSCLCFTECLSHGTYFCLLAHLYALTMKVGCKCDHDFIHTSISCFHFSSADFMHNDCEPELEKSYRHTQGLQHTTIFMSPQEADCCSAPLFPPDHIS